MVWVLWAPKNPQIGNIKRWLFNDVNAERKIMNSGEEHGAKTENLNARLSTDVPAEQMNEWHTKYLNAKL
eukprot:c48231_g1_i1 orf=25-234(-)